jgi:hypothetical protein
MACAFAGYTEVLVLDAVARDYTDFMTPIAGVPPEHYREGLPAAGSR